jgi:hypothetical protein
VQVYDRAPGLPLPRELTRDAESGRGLRLVAALAADWGWSPVCGGKVVWAIIGDGPSTRSTGFSPTSRPARERDARSDDVGPAEARTSPANRGGRAGAGR